MARARPSMTTIRAQQVANPAVESQAFTTRAAAAAFRAEKEAEGFRCRETTRFNGRDMRTRQKLRAFVIHVYEKGA